MGSSAVNPDIFRAYDIRGVYGRDLSPEIMERIGNAFARRFVREKVVVGMDGRKSGPCLKEAFISGVRGAGKGVVDVGVVPRSACLFWGWTNNLPSAYITASHLPKEWNGVKLARADGVDFFQRDIDVLKEEVLAGRFVASRSEGRLSSADSLTPYKEYLLAKVKRASRPLRVVVDCGNGTGGLLVPELFEQLGFSLTVLFGEVDGEFPNRPSEIEEKALDKLRAEVRRADVGVAYDGDSDRMALMDERGRLLAAEAAAYVILRELAREHPGPIVANVECLKVMEELAKRLGRTVCPTPVGNAFMVHAVRTQNACLGLERSGHFCIPSLLPIDDGIAASLYAASALSRCKEKLSALADSLPSFPFRRAKIACEDSVKFRVMERVGARLLAQYENVCTLDGVRVGFAFGWVLIRASNTEPAIRLSVEAETEEALCELEERFLNLLREEIDRARGHPPP